MGKTRKAIRAVALEIRLAEQLCGTSISGSLREHLKDKLDAELVKAYAVDFCGTKTIKDATREQVANFVLQLADCAEKDRNALICQLNSYVHPKQEVIA